MNPATYDYNQWNIEEIEDFKYFIAHQLAYIDPVNKVINTHSKNGKNIFYNVGHTRPNGHTYISCNGRNRSKDRFIYYYLYRTLPPTRKGLNKCSLPKEQWNIPKSKWTNKFTKLFTLIKF